MTTETQNYLAAEKAFIKMFNLQVGQKVKVLRAVKDRDAGWANSWNKLRMDKSIGETLTVSKFSPDGYGIYLSNTYYYPFHALEVIQPKDTSIKLNSGSYTAVINGATGVVKVGCQVIQPDVVKKIYDASQKALKGIVAEPKKVAKKAPAKKAVAKKTVAKKATKKVAAKKTARRSIFD